jgi:hypothetical protein
LPARPCTLNIAFTYASKGRSASVTVGYNAWLAAPSAVMHLQLSALYRHVVFADEVLDVGSECLFKFDIVEVNDEPHIVEPCLGRKPMLVILEFAKFG